MRSSLVVPKHPLYGKLKAAGISHLAAAYHAGVPHGSLTKYLTGYYPMPTKIEISLEELLKTQGGHVNG